MASTPDEAISYNQFICIGTGFSGIGLGATLQRWYGITDVQFFEREAEIGGTWFLNNYPGTRKTIPSTIML
jgi:cation diffusion facilitator CzcD-associated flavoprotein CzcO